MSKTTNKFSRPANFAAGLSAAKWILICITVVIIVAAVAILAFLNRSNHVGITQNEGIEITPTQIRTIENIGEWEFLSVADEELVDSVKHGFFGESELVRIYYGTLRLGVNLHKAAPGWLKTHNDTVVATLPPIELLDNDFIDEARTQSFYQTGTWTEADRKALYNKAYRLMKQRCLTPENIETAERNAKSQFENMLLSMGFEHSRIVFETPSKAKK